MQEINIVIENSLLQDNIDFLPEIFGNKNGEWDSEYPKSNISFESENLDIYDLLVKYKFFKSKGDAKRNWKPPDSIKHKFDGKHIPRGFSDLGKIGKLKRELAIYNPSYDPFEYYYDALDPFYIWLEL